jgi:hypothetical protein
LEGEIGLFKMRPFNGKIRNILLYFNIRTSAAVPTVAVMEPTIEKHTVRIVGSAQLPTGGCQRDPSGISSVIDYALLYGAVHPPDILYDKQSP